ncbi:hypothetical protein ACFRDV_11830 [Streptomyces fagopyri]|uniref:hypothetical protein n=1 Tax=Streptomyces fagopyri TaxID=2662397 RepID=UPI0036BEE6AF
MRRRRGPRRHHDHPHLHRAHEPEVDHQDNTTAGTWKVQASASGNDWDYVSKDVAATVQVKRYAKLTVNASPEPVKKGKALTVGGHLTRAT